MANLNDVDYTRHKKQLTPHVDSTPIPQRYRAPFVRDRELPDNGRGSALHKASDADENMAMADGISLDMDSPEYWERDMDLKHIPQQEHDEISRQVKQRRQRKHEVDERESDAWHEEYSQDIVDDRADVVQEQQQAVTPRLRKVVGARHLEKMTVVHSLRGLGNAARRTSGKEDDTAYAKLLRDVDDLGVVDVEQDAEQLQEDIERGMSFDTDGV